MSLFSSSPVMQLAWNNFLQIPSNVMTDWPFAFGFAGIDVGYAWLQRNMPQFEMEWVNMTAQALLLGVSDAAKFGYWDGYSCSAGSGGTPRGGMAAM